MRGAPKLNGGAAVYTGRGAVISPDGVYRYALWRAWGAGRPATFIMLNPSTADAEQDDPTIRRCIGYAKAWGCGGLLVLNLFALRATDPAELHRHPDPVGPDNDDRLCTFLKNTYRPGDIVVAAWGTSGCIRSRGREVRQMFEREMVPLEVLRLTKHWDPAHPLYLPAALKPVPWTDLPSTESKGAVP